MKSILLFIFLVLPRPTPDDNEVTWSAYLAETVQGEAEYKLPTGKRVDVLTDEVAWEVEWTHKWEESIGQALYYAITTDRIPGVWLLKESGDDEEWNACRLVIERLRRDGTDIRFRTEEVNKKDETAD